ncbi:hypothetical protein D0Y65_003711 [Glycine soja]|uniref:Uncharacterized protein n=1 Tax=Glycine soja TaxID=3848 RepID=A0A445LN85_GLYSO|nr:hypothetical protein D0Y65_003711 [Glycine soja]
MPSTMSKKYAHKKTNGGREEARNQTREEGRRNKEEGRKKVTVEGTRGRRNASDVGCTTTPKFWEAFLIFGNLALTELNITGNAVADENFRSFLVKVLPTLTWLGDEELS